jgi:hypothetical protein
MNDAQAVQAVQHGQTPDQATIKRLWLAGYVEVQDVTDHDTRPIGARELMAMRITPKGMRLLEVAKNTHATVPG